MNVTVLRLSEQKEVLHVIEYIIIFHLWASPKVRKIPDHPLLQLRIGSETRVRKQHTIETKGLKSNGRGGGYGFIDLVVYFIGAN